MAKVAIIYYSATGTVHRMAHAVEAGARRTGANARLRHVAELVSDKVIAQNPAWVAHRAEVASGPVAVTDDLEWADAYIFGTPTRFGNVSAQLKQFIDSTGSLWAEGLPADKVVAGFTSSTNPHGAQESTILALYNTMYHWGAIVVAPGYTDSRVAAAGGNPYGASAVDPGDGSAPHEHEIESAGYLGERVARYASAIAESTLKPLGV